jgi:hypothetical protein
MKPSIKPTSSKIPKPYSSYTIYFRLERFHILQSSGSYDSEIKHSRPHYDAVEHPRPRKYVDLVLPPNWYSSLHRKEAEKRRKHRKTEGGISKTMLTSMISKSWKEVHAEVKGYCERLAGVEKRRYEERLKGIESDDSVGTEQSVLSSVVSASTAQTSVSLMPPLPPVISAGFDPVTFPCSSPFPLAVSDSCSVTSIPTTRFDMPVTAAVGLRPKPTRSMTSPSSVLFQSVAPTSGHLASCLSIMESDENIHPDLFDETNIDDEFRFEFSGGAL